MCDSCCRKFRTVIELSDELIHLADEAEVSCGENGSLVLCGIIRDNAYKIKTETQRQFNKSGDTAQ